MAQASPGPPWTLGRRPIQAAGSLDVVGRAFTVSATWPLSCCPRRAASPFLFFVAFHASSMHLPVHGTG